MAYQIDSGIWSSVFAVPTAIVDKHIKMCSPLSLKILLVMLRYSGKAVDAQWLSGQLNISAADISDALGYWIGAGIVSVTDQVISQPEPEKLDKRTDEKAKRPSEPIVTKKANTVTGQKIVTIASRPKITQQDIVQIANQDHTIAQLLGEAQNIIGSPLTPVESEIIVALCSYYGMKSDAVLMLLGYCISSGHKSLHYLEKTAANWLERGIITHEQVEHEILRLTTDNENEKKVRKAFGLYNRGLTPKERDYIPRWFSLGLDETLIFLACERAAENTGKVSFAYADKILTSWKAKGIKTIKDATNDLNSFSKQSEPKKNKSAQTGKDSSLDMDKIHKLLHQPYDE